HQVAAFKFGGRGESYAEKQGKPVNIGLIAAKVIAEKEPDMSYTSLSNYNSSTLLGGNDPIAVRRGSGNSKGVYTMAAVGAAGPSSDMGTEFGKKKDHRVTTTNFDRGKELTTLVLEYASRESLVKAGII